MIDLKALREDPDRFREGARRKRRGDVDIDRILELDRRRRACSTRADELRSEQKKLAKESGPQIGRLMGKMKGLEGGERSAVEAEVEDLKRKPAELKERIREVEEELSGLEPELEGLLLRVPQPPDADVPDGGGSEDNVEISRWSPGWWDDSKSFEENRGFRARSHEALCASLGLVDFERGVKLAGSRSYMLTGMGMRLHQAMLRFAFDVIVDEHGFMPVSAPVVVREEAMLGTGFFPGGKDQTYLVSEEARGAGSDLYLTGTGEVALMGMYGDEILDEGSLPLKLATVSTCFRREAGAAGRDTAGLYRVHQFDKVEQVVICRADEAESRRWHREMIGIVEGILGRLELPHRLLQCCTGDLGDKNADMVDVECWMPSRGGVGEGGVAGGGWGETHSASRLYDYQCRRLNMRYRGEGTGGRPVFCHSLNNTVLASPRFLIPLLEMYQEEDGSVRVPEALRGYMGGVERIG